MFLLHLTTAILPYRDLLRENMTLRTSRMIK